MTSASSTGTWRAGPPAAPPHGAATRHHSAAPLVAPVARSAAELLPRRSRTRFLASSRYAAKRSGSQIWNL